MKPLWCLLDEFITESTRMTHLYVRAVCDKINLFVLKEWFQPSLRLFILLYFYTRIFSYFMQLLSAQIKNAWTRSLVWGMTKFTCIFVGFLMLWLHYLLTGWRMDLALTQRYLLTWRQLFRIRFIHQVNQSKVHEKFAYFMAEVYITGR